MDQPDLRCFSSALRTLADVPLLNEDQRLQALEAAEKLEEATVYVAIIGDFKRGKSTLVNALLGAPVLPTGVIPVTAVPTLCRWGETPRLTVRCVGRADAVHELDELARFVTEEGNPRNQRGVRDVLVEYPAPLLARGIVLVDTPGQGSILAHNTAAAEAFLPRVDVAIAVLTIDAPLSQSEAMLLRRVVDQTARLAVCLNKVDLIDESERQRAIAFVASALTATIEGIEVPVFPISARLAAEGRPDSGLDAVREWLEQHVAAERTAIVLERARHTGHCLLAVARASLRLEQETLTLPAEEAARRRGQFEETLRDLEADEQEDRAVLQDAARRVVTAVIDPQIDALRVHLRETLAAAPEEAWAEIKAALVASACEEIERRMATALEAAVQRHVLRLTERIGRLMASAAELFHVDLEPLPPVAEVMTMPSVRIEDVDDAGAVARSVVGLRRTLPGRFGDRWRERAHRDLAAETADRLSGRVRYAATEAIRAAVRDLEERSRRHWQAVAGGLRDAIARSEDAIAAGRQAISEARDRLHSLQATLEAVEKKLASPTASEGRRASDSRR